MCGDFAVSRAMYRLIRAKLIMNDRRVAISPEARAAAGREDRRARGDGSFIYVRKSRNGCHALFIASLLGDNNDRPSGIRSSNLAFLRISRIYSFIPGVRSHYAREFPRRNLNPFSIPATRPPLLLSIAQQIKLIELCDFLCVRN